MKTTEIAEALESYNAWRRGANTEQPNPTEIGRLLDAAIKRLRELDLINHKKTPARSRGISAMASSTTH